MVAKEKEKELAALELGWPRLVEEQFCPVEELGAVKNFAFNPLLPKLERLKYSGLFQQAYQKGKPIFSKNFVITFTQTLPAYKDRMPFTGFVVSTAFSKKAVLRNRIKRQMREVYRLYRMDLRRQVKLRQIGLLVISIKKNFALSSYSDIKQELESLLDKVIKD